MCGFMPPPGLPKRMAGMNNFIAVIAVTWACFKSGCARSSTRCAKGYAFRSGSSYPSTRSELRKRRTDFLYGSEPYQSIVSSFLDLPEVELSQGMIELQDERFGIRLFCDTKEYLR